MRIGTWNLAGRWDERHEALLRAQECDVWLLTEVNARAVLPGSSHRTQADMVAGRSWAAVFARAPLQTRPDPHPASALAVVDGVAFSSSVLPWRSCGSASPWGPGTHAEKTERALRTLLAGLPTGDLVWGGDWNHSLQGAELVGSGAGRQHIEAALAERDLRVPTTTLPSAVGGVSSIDHVAVPSGWPATTADRVVAEVGGVRLSDHDLYVVDVLT